jgi:hypothetical protein
MQRKEVYKEPEVRGLKREIYVHGPCRENGASDFISSGSFGSVTRY